MIKREFDAQKEITNITNWIKKYFVENGPNSKAIIGMSGGKDSTIAAALLVRALGAERVIGVIMPDGKQADLEDAEEICRILNIQYHIINITNITEHFYDALSSDYKINNTVLTNTPSRIRMTMLYAVAANVHGRVVNTCNKSEDYVGYSTKYGDLAGDFSIFKNYTVREVLAIGDIMNEIPSNYVHKIPMDGMCGKIDEDNLGFSYDTLDEYLINGVMPEYKIYKNIEERHNRNKHKACINLPAPYNVTGRHSINCDYAWNEF